MNNIVVLGEFEEFQKPVRFEPIYGYVRSLQMEGLDLSDSSAGVSLITTLRVGKLYGMVTKRDFHHDNRTWPPIEPPGIDAKAKANRLPFYFRARNELEIKQILSARTPVLICVPITEQWYSTESGVIFFPFTEFCPQRHAVSVLGYSEASQYFDFANSWGAKWGDQGYGKLPYGYIEQYCTAAASVILFPSIKRREFKSCPVGGGAWAVETLLVNVPGRSTMHAVCVFDIQTGEDIGWAFTFIEKDTLDTEEFFVAPSHRRKGVGRVLQRSILQVSDLVSKPVLYWLPHIDNVLQDRNILDLAYNFQMKVFESEFKWAAKKMLYSPR